MDGCNQRDLTTEARRHGEDKDSDDCACSAQTLFEMKLPRCVFSFEKPDFSVSPRLRGESSSVTSGLSSTSWLGGVDALGAGLRRDARRRGRTATSDHASRRHMHT
jgi:hypothetical protein